jgi:hypothetical protein
MHSFRPAPYNARRRNLPAARVSQRSMLTLKAPLHTPKVRSHAPADRFHVPDGRSQAPRPRLATVALAGRLAPICVALLCAVLACAALAPVAALASRNQVTFFEANSELLNPKTRAKTLATLQHLGVRALRVELYWSHVAPASKSSKRPNFDATNPASYSWGQYDPLLAEAKRLGWQVLLTVTAPAPMWATASHKDRLGVTNPSDAQFQQLMTAVGRHYGSEVSLFAIWNEANHPQFLLPQFKSNGSPASPRLYRGLVHAGIAGLRAAGIGKPRVIMGETAPFGFDRVNVRREGALHPVAPLAFLRESLCLDSHYHKAPSCEELPIYGYSHHAYITRSGPFHPPANGDDVTIGVLSRLSSALDRAARAGAIPAHVPIYLTEFGIQSYPNHELGVPQPEQAEWDALCEKIAWGNGRVAAFSQYLLRDDPLGGKPGSGVHGGFIGFQTGLIEHNGKVKPLYSGFPLPLVVSRAPHGFSLWGLVRPATKATRVKVLVEPKGSRKYRQLAIVSTNSRGYWTLHSSLNASRWRVSWRSPSGAAYNGPPIGVT